jgi:hypothetical protein
MNQEQIVDHLGLTIAHVNRVLRRLSESGAATLQHRIVNLTEMALSQLAAPFRTSSKESPKFGGVFNGILS